VLGVPYPTGNARLSSSCGVSFGLSGRGGVNLSLSSRGGIGLCPGSGRDIRCGCGLILPHIDINKTPTPNQERNQDDEEEHTSW
jgi:hypothetical protein